MIKLKKYSNGSFSYYSEKFKGHRNIPSELAEMIIELRNNENFNNCANRGAFIQVISHKPEKLPKKYIGSYPKVKHQF